jgi:TonB family protein
MDTQVDTGPNLLLDWQSHGYAPRFLEAGVGSLAVHILLISFLVFLLNLPAPAPDPVRESALNLRRVTPLIDPPRQITQKEPNRAKVSKEVNVEGLLARSQTPAKLPTPPAPRRFQPPLPGTPAPAPVQPAPRMAEPPKLDAQLNTPVLPPAAGAPNLPPPQIQSEEKPKLAFETPGQSGTATQKGAAFGKIAPPKTSVDEAIRSVAHGGGQGGIVIGDMDPPPNLRDSLRAPPVPGQTRSSLELLSDPQGVDFKPYLIRILATVRRNWFAVIPESAHLGRRGMVLLQFVIDREGQVPKLVIAMPSGAEALDRAAVAGVSASVPFPPLPPEYKGRDIRLQFSFKYNVP